MPRNSPIPNGAACAPAGHEQPGEHRERGQQDAQRPDPGQHRQPERQPAQPGQRHPAAEHAERVDEHAQPAEQQHLDQGLAERRPRHVDLGQRDREDQRPDRRPPPPGQAAHDSAERQHRAAAEHRRHQQRAAEPGQPRPGGEHERQPGQERRGEVSAGQVEPGVREDQPPGASERCRRRRDPHGPVLGDPVPVLQVDARVADAEELLGPERRLPHPEPGRDRDRGQQRADRHADPPAIGVRPVGGRGVSRHVQPPELRPLHRQAPHPEVAQRHRERHEDDQYRQRQQPPGQQHPGPRHEQRDGQQGGRHREDTERPAGQPPPPLGQPLALLGRAPVRTAEERGVRW